MKISSTPTKAAVKYIPTKYKTKSRVPLEILAVREKHADEKTTSKCNKKNPTNTNVLTLKKAQNELASIYIKDRQNIYKIREIRLETQWKIGNLGYRGKR